MARYNGTPRFYLSVWGDWASMISAREYRDVLLNQGPDDDDAADYKCYEIPCKDTAAMLAACAVFRPLATRISVGFAVDAGEFRFACESECGWNSTDQPHYWATIDDQRKMTLAEHLDAAMMLARELESKVE